MAVLESYNVQAATEVKNIVPGFKDALPLIWSALPEKAIEWH